LTYNRVDTGTFLVRAVEHLRRLTPAPDVVLATGDLVDAARQGNPKSTNGSGYSWPHWRCPSS
jgi:hypothetical protein